MFFAKMIENSPFKNLVEEFYETEKSGCNWNENVKDEDFDDF